MMKHRPILDVDVDVPLLVLQQHHYSEEGSKWSCIRKIIFELINSVSMLYEKGYKTLIRPANMKKNGGSQH